MVVGHHQRYGRRYCTTAFAHIFDRFYRVDESRSTEGIGLGLAIALDIARAHGGDISVASEFDKGTTFTVTLAVR